MFLPHLTHLKVLHLEVSRLSDGTPENWFVSLVKKPFAPNSSQITIGPFKEEFLQLRELSIKTHDRHVDGVGHVKNWGDFSDVCTNLVSLKYESQTVGENDAIVGFIEKNRETMRKLEVKNSLLRDQEDVSVVCVCVGVCVCVWEGVWYVLHGVC